MLDSKLLNKLAKMQEIVSDAARISGKELKISLDQAKNKVKKYSLLQKRKELFAELGRYIYESFQEELPEAVSKFLKESEMIEILEEIKEVDLGLKKHSST